MVTDTPTPDPLAALSPEERRRISRALSGAFVSELERIAAEVRKGGVVPRNEEAPGSEHPSAERSAA